jgi:hypothetical protein
LWQCALILERCYENGTKTTNNPKNLSFLARDGEP